jgi:hydroxymethylbilane synthase
MTPTPDRPFRIGTRSSPLALAQAEIAKVSLCATHGWATEAVRLVPMLSSGDKMQDRPLAEIGGKALWTKELERALIEGEIDIAVHSMKDVETVRTDAFIIAAMLPRADVRDRLIGADSILSLRPHALVGTSSPRRAAQLKALRPDLRTEPIRGNVSTRLAKVASGEFDATLLAAAGLDRLGMTDIGTAIKATEMLPAASQGAIGIDCLDARAEIAALLAAVNHTETYRSVMAERAFLEALGGTCHSPIAALAREENGIVRLSGQILSEDGSESHSGESDDPAGRAVCTMKLLIIRPEPGASATAARTKAVGYDPVLLPFFEIRARAWAVPDPEGYDALLITSANAVRHAGPGLRSLSALPIHAVGERTASAARDAGLTVASVGASGVEDAIETAVDAGHHRLLWLVGEEHKKPVLPESLRLDTVICYAAEALPLPADAAEAIASVDIVALHSPRAARRFAETAAKLGLVKFNMIIAAFSPAIADAAGAGWHGVVVAEAPTDSALLSAVAELVKLQAVIPSRKEDK